MDGFRGFEGTNFGVSSIDITTNREYVKATQYQYESIIKQNIDKPKIRNIDSQNTTSIQNLASTLKSFNLPDINVNSFKNSLINSRVEGVREFVNKITKEDIKNFLIIVAITAPLILSGVGVPTAVGVIGARLGITTVMTRIVTQIMMRPNVSSTIMGLIPGMKNIAPNQSLAFTVSELKHVLPTAFGVLTSKASEFIGKK